MKTPSEQPLSQLNDCLPKKINLFICCSSFEQRCLSVPKALHKQSINQCFVVQNKNNIEFVGKNGDKIKSRFIESYFVDIDTDNPIKTHDSLLASLVEFLAETPPQHILVDISTFTRESLLILVRLLSKLLRPTDNLIFVYVGAKSYAESQNSKTNSTPWLSKGIRDIRSVLGYPGDGLPSRDSHLILLVGFEYQRAAQLIDTYEPSILSIGYSKDETFIGHAKQNKIFHEKIVSMYGSAVNKFTFSAIDPLYTKQSILNQVSIFPNHNTVLSSLNTKLSTLGAALAVFENEDIQICYAQAETYNISDYTDPKDSFYIFIPDMKLFTKQ